MNKCIRYQQRLGDVLRCLPACKYLADQSHEVVLDCYDQYHGVFDLVTYVRPGTADDIIDLEIWPNRYNAFRDSKLSWMDFVYQHPVQKCFTWSEKAEIGFFHQSRTTGCP